MPRKTSTHVTLVAFLMLSLTNIQAGDTVLTAPISALQTAQTIPKSISRAIGTISVNGLLAAEFAMDISETRASWRAVLPTRADFEESIPFLWHPSLQALLPTGARTLLENQKNKISSDWAAISNAFPSLFYDPYVYNWFLVSTRTFYYTSPKFKSKKPLNRDDCLALIPLADNFNHADVGCEVTYSPAGYKISADRRYKKGEEVYISYGDHSNDFLLAEYGFILAENKWDSVCLDEFILPLFSESQKQELKDAGFFGKYTLDAETICYRTQVAVRILCVPINQWQRLVTNGLDENDKHQAGVDRILLKILKAHLASTNERAKQVEILNYGSENQRETLIQRWAQIRLLLIAAMQRIEQ